MKAKKDPVFTERELAILCWALNCLDRDTLYMYDPHPDSFFSQQSDEFWVAVAAKADRGFKRLSQVSSSTRAEAVRALRATPLESRDRCIIDYTNAELDTLIGLLQH